MGLESLQLETSLHWIDWAIIGLYLIGTMAIGFYVKRFIADMSDYVVAGRALQSNVGIATMIGTELGLVTVMYSAQKGFTGGFAAFHIGLTAAIVCFLVGVTGFIVVPLRRMGVMTIPEYYEKRFGRGVRIFGGAILAASGILNMGMFLRAGSLFVMGMTGMSSAYYLKLIMTVLLGLVLLYTILGGMVSIVITDYVQFVVLSFGLLVACGLAVNHLGWNHIVTTLSKTEGVGFNPFTTEGFGKAYVAWMFFLGLVNCALWQTAVIRACSAASVKVVKKLYIWSSLGFMIRVLIPAFLGACAVVYITERPDLAPHFLPPGEASSDMGLSAMPIFLSQIVPVGLAGIITAGLLAAFMSTHDSYLLCWSSVLTQDVIAPLCRLFDIELPTKARLFIARLLIFLIGIFLLIWGLWYPLGQDMWDYMAITGSIYFTGAFSLLFLGIYWRGASRVGAYLGLCSGFLGILGLKPVQNMVGTDLDSPEVGLATVGLAVVSMVVGSLVFPDRTSREKAEREAATESENEPEEE